MGHASFGIHYSRIKFTPTCVRTFDQKAYLYIMLRLERNKSSNYKIPHIS